MSSVTTLLKAPVLLINRKLLVSDEYLLRCLGSTRASLTNASVGTALQLGWNSLITVLINTFLTVVCPWVCPPMMHYANTGPPVSTSIQHSAPSSFANHVMCWPEWLYMATQFDNASTQRVQ